MKKLLSWFEIPASDFDRAVKFYQNVTETDLQVVGCEGDMMACFPDDGVNVSGAVISSPGYKPSPDGVIISFFSETDLNNFLGRVETNGGKTIIPKTKIQAENRGYFAVFMDTEGNRLGVYSES